MKTRTIFSFFKVLVFVRINSGFVDAGFPVWFMISYLIFVRKRYILEGLNHRLLRNPWVNVLFLAHILRYLFGFEYNCALMCTRSSTSRIYFPPLLSRMSKVVAHYSKGAFNNYMELHLTFWVFLGTYMKISAYVLWPF